MGFLPNKSERPPGSLWPAITIGIFASIGGILFGYDTASISGILTMPYWIKAMATVTGDNGEPVVTTAQTSLVVSILSAGTFVGALLAGPTGDWLGRRWGLIFANCVFIVGVALQTIAHSLPLFIAGRVVAGLGVGLVSALVPLYQSESAPKWVRGTIVGCYQLCINLGLILAACVNESTGQRDDSGSYRIPVAVQIIFALILAGGMLFLPETPRYLVQAGKVDKAKEALGFLYSLPVDHPALEVELCEIKAHVEVERASGFGYLDCWKPPILKRQATGCVLQAMQQLSGINFIIYYGTRFFDTVGIEDPFLATIIVNVVAFVSTIPGLYLVERMGRRNLLLIGAAGMALSQLVLAVLGVTVQSVAGNNALIAVVCIYIFFFEFSWGPCAWIVTGEMFPLHVRSKALSMTTASNWLWNFVLGFITPYMVDSGPGNANLGSKVFFIWMGFCFLAIVFVWKYIYETKGLSLEQIEELYQECSEARKSAAFRKTWDNERLAISVASNSGTAGDEKPETSAKE